MKPTTLRPVASFDDVLEPITHDVLEGHPLADDVVAVTALEQRLLDAREAAAQQAYDEVVADVGLRLLRTATVVVLQQRDQAVRDRSTYVAGGRTGASGRKSSAIAAAESIPNPVGCGRTASGFLQPSSAYRGPSYEDG